VSSILISMELEEPLVAMIHEIEVHEAGIVAWAKTLHNSTVCLQVEDFQPYWYDAQVNCIHL